MDLGQPVGHEPAFRRPAVVVSVDILNNSPGQPVMVVPITSTAHGLRSHVEIEPGSNGLGHTSYARCDQLRVVSATRWSSRRGMVAPVRCGPSTRPCASSSTSDPAGQLPTQRSAIGGMFRWPFDFRCLCSVAAASGSGADRPPIGATGVCMGQRSRSLPFRRPRHAGNSGRGRNAPGQDVSSSRRHRSTRWSTYRCVDHLRDRSMA